MPTDSGPSDLIQQALDILQGDNRNVRITCQASARMGGGVARWDGEVVAFARSTSYPQLVVRNLRPTGEPVEAGARDHMYIDFAQIIDIEIQET